MLFVIFFLALAIVVVSLLLLKRRLSRRSIDFSKGSFEVPRTYADQEIEELAKKYEVSPSSEPVVTRANFLQMAADARRQCEQTRRDYQANVNAARAALEKAEKAHAASADCLQRKISQALLIAQCAGLRLYPDCVMGDGTTIRLTPDIKVDLEMSGDYVYQRNGEKTYAVDKRILFVTVSTPEGRITGQISGSDELEARRFADAIYNAAAMIDQQAMIRNMKLSTLYSEYARVDADAAAMEQARQTLRATEAYVQPVVLADNRLASIMAQATPEDLERMKAFENSKLGRCEIALIIIAAVMGAFVVAPLGLFLIFGVVGMVVLQ